MQSQKERESLHKLHERFRVLKDLLRDTVIVRQIEKVREKGMKFGERLIQTDTFYQQSCLFVGSHTKTTIWHTQLPTENNMFVWEKKQLLDTVNSGSIFCTKAGPTKIYCILHFFAKGLAPQQTMMQLHFFTTWNLC